MTHIKFDQPEHLGERLWILAGDYRQFKHYDRMFKELGFDPIYLSEVRKIRGVRGERFICVGTWYEKRPRELDEILEVLKLSDFTEMKHEVIEREERERRLWERRHWYASAGFDKPHVHCPDIPDPPEEFIKAEEMTI